jgi:aminoglycoside phosphotransferase family enzyme/predicted kinase
MELHELIAALSRPEAYAGPAGEVIVRQTHISAVFLAGDHAFKVKKPVDLGFLDFSTPEKRLHFCREEVRLNRRLAPSVYLGVVPVLREGGRLRFGEPGEAGNVVEWAVKMRRLPDSATLRARLYRGELQPDQLRALARFLAAFHASAEGGPRIAPFGRFEYVAGNARENFAQAADLVGTTVHKEVFDRLAARTEAELDRLRLLIEGRARRGVPRDTHGDLHLDHVYLFPDRPPPEDLAIIDCIEFNDRFRFADPVADMAFLVMDLRFRGANDLALAFSDAYFRAADDGDGPELLAFYTAYRAMIRAKVEGFESLELEVPGPERDTVLQKARAHWLLALTTLETPARRPCLLLVAGLPGAGKSTLARSLAQEAGFTLLRTDLVRKELAGLPASAFDERLYTPESTERTYAECLRRAEAALFEGRRVLVDATFRWERWRQAFLAAARRWGVPTGMILCQADPDTVRQRLRSRTADASDADWPVYQQLAREWEEVGPATRALTHPLDTNGTAEVTLTRARSLLVTLL